MTEPVSWSSIPPTSRPLPARRAPSRARPPVMGSACSGPPPPHGQVVIPAGSISATVLIDVLADSVVEPIESFTLQLDSAVGMTSGTGLSIANTAGGSIAPLGPQVVASTDMAALGSIDPAGIAY